ncbi:hypothetical protein [Microcoleus sp.]
MPFPQENSLFVEQAGKPVLENGARCELPRLSGDRGNHRQTVGSYYI